jgi:hypothetical protein
VNAELTATPRWFGEFDKFVFKEAKALASIRNKITGVKWHVDHIVPIQSKLVCGFHAGYNIQVITAKENILKGNRYWPYMP